VYIHVSVGVFTSLRSFFLSRLVPGEFNFPVDGALLDAWPDFPGIKVGKIYLYTSLLTIWMALLVNRDTEYDYF
jgi:hypothetical protein